MIKLLSTGDGSFTFYNHELNETYHSVHGAWRESEHVFIRAGLEWFARLHSPRKIIIGESGFGTGLNALLARQWAEKNRLPVWYETFEKYPLSYKNWRAYVSTLPSPSRKLLTAIHLAPWEQEVRLSPYFVLIKHLADLRRITPRYRWHVHFFDAFSPRIQPGLWTEEVLQNMYDNLSPGGVFVTYSAKGSVRRNLEKAGFQTEKLPGPPGKREMLRGVKPSG